MQLSAEIIANLRIVLKKIAFLEYLKVNELDELIKALDKRPFMPGEVIIKQNTIGETFYILASGSVGVFKEKFLSKKRVATLASNDIFGEMALIDDVKRSATVIGEEAGELYFLPREAFKKILLANPGIGELIRHTADYRKAKNRALDLK
ncbi:MAG: cyclic nucleotide-binding domain-containing protein [Candidatus Coatesbacteria bacterium]